MGAIGGYFARAGGMAAADLLHRQASALAHRGPAGYSIYCDGPIGFMHRRDQVLPAVHVPEQPCVDASGRYVIVCSGRIFNQTVIEKMLPSWLEHRPTMLEVMLQAYVSWGDDAFRRFNGAFACAIWDRTEQSLLLVRDPCGFKQLYFSVTSDSVVFGTEIKAIFADRTLRQAPDHVGVANYLALNRLLFRSDHTTYSGVRRLLPAQVMHIDARREHRATYWELDPERRMQHSRDEDCVDEIRELLIDAVRVRLPQGNHIGADLSGGFDSSSIVCLIDHLDKTERGGRAVLDTFSFEFDTDDADEVELIDIVASRVGARHHHLKPMNSSFLDNLPAAIRAHDGPLLESSILLLWGKTQRARAEGLDVLLSGLGGDEVFMGTLYYLSDLFRSGHWLRLLEALGTIYPVDKSTGRKSSLGHLLRSYVLSPMVPDWIRRMRGTFEGQPYPPPWINTTLSREVGLEHGKLRGGNPYRTAYDRQNFDLFHYELLGAALPFHDDCSGAFAIDTRFPFLDLRVIEAMFALDRRWKLDGGNIRMMQKRAMEPFLPPAVLSDHLKKNFHCALHGFTQRTYAETFRKLLHGTGQSSREFIDWRVLQRYGDAFLDGTVTDPGPLWLALNLEIWLNDLQR